MARSGADGRPRMDFIGTGRDRWWPGRWKPPSCRSLISAPPHLGHEVSEARVLQPEEEFLAELQGRRLRPTPLAVTHGLLAPPPTGGRYSRSRHLPHSTHLRPSSPPSFPVLELPVIFPWPLAQSLCPHLWTLRSSLAFHHLQPYPSPVSYPWPRPARLAEPARRPRPYPEAPPQSLSPRPAPCPVTPSRTAFARLVKPSSWL